MTLEDVKKEVADIERVMGDDEMAHSYEDALHESFIHHIADSDLGELSEMAKEVLKTSDLNFARWCA